MNKSKIRKKRKQKYIMLIDNIALEIGIAFVSDFYWKNKLKTLLSAGILSISYKDKKHLPEYIKKEIICNRLGFSVKSPENSGSAVFELSSKEFPQITAKITISDSKQ